MFLVWIAHSTRRKGADSQSEKPYMAAQRFLQNNELEMSYIDQVVKFIEQNTAGVQLGTGGEEYQDPFTGMIYVECYGR